MCSTNALEYSLTFVLNMVIMVILVIMVTMDIMVIIVIMVIMVIMVNININIIIPDCIDSVYV